MPAEREALTVSQLMALVRRALEPVDVVVVGEVSELTDRAGYKAVYFTLADDSAVVSCLIWRDAYERSDCALRCGMLVSASGAMTVYPPKGRMQFQVRRLAPAGQGLLRVQVAALARRLEGEGLMLPERKRTPPRFPQRIGVVTSPRGKAVHDVLRTLKRRFPAAEVVVAGVTVEGAEAVDEIVGGLSALSHAGVDVVIVARGGGSYEDLMPFNTEEVVRAIAGMAVPVVTGIGHEPDTTIADMVADVRASTPTGAAEAVAPADGEVLARLAAEERALGRAFAHVVLGLEHRLRVAARSPVLADVRGWLAVRGQSIDLAADGLARSGRRLTPGWSARLDTARRALAARSEVLTAGSATRLSSVAAALDALSPTAVLARGYALVYREDGHIARAASDLAIGERLTSRLADGTVASRVEEIGS